MSPRPYHLGKRQAQVDESRRRVLDAARDLLAGASSYSEFTVDSVAKRADVARATVYYQFQSKVGLLEAVCDDLAEAAGMAQLAEVFEEADPLRAIDRFIAVFAGFWEADRAVMRRLRSLAALDPDVGAVIAARDERARRGLVMLLGRLGPRPPRGARIDELARTLHVLMGFETFDGLAGEDRSAAEVVPIVADLFHHVLARAGLRRPSGP